VIYAYGKCHLAHRLAWFLMTGNWPAKYIDHINGDRTDNRWSNLREADYTQSACNRGPNVGIMSGLKGAYKMTSGHHRNFPWYTRIKIGNKQKIVGYFATAEEAHAAYKALADELHGEFAWTPLKGESQ
jgi:HNH endonuclease